jgi:hypothetical protein
MIGGLVVPTTTGPPRDHQRRRVHQGLPSMGGGLERRIPRSVGDHWRHWQHGGGLCVGDPHTDPASARRQQQVPSPTVAADGAGVAPQTPHCAILQPSERLCDRPQDYGDDAETPPPRRHAFAAGVRADATNRARWEALYGPQQAIRGRQSKSSRSLAETCTYVSSLLSVQRCKLVNL